MQIDELTRGMQAGEHAMDAPLPDVEALRGRGRVGRRNRRFARVGAAAAVLAVVVGGWLVTDDLRKDASPPRPAKPDSTKVLSAYERRVLAEVPGAYAVGGQVVVPAPIDPEGTWSLAHRVDAFTGRLAPLGWHSMSWLTDGLVPSTVARPAFMHAPPPEHTDVYQDSGPMRVGCRPVSDARCGLFYVLGNRDIGWFTGYRLGDADFLRTGRPMELIPGGTLENNRFQPTVVGGMHGTTTTQVVLTLKDGTTANATVDSGKISTGDTIFWAVVDSPPVRATASDGAGRVVEDHELTPCDDPVDCSTR
jgi:hypothetical protein